MILYFFFVNRYCNISNKDKEKHKKYQKSFNIYISMITYSSVINRTTFNTPLPSI